jgi:hypothetical protein
MRTIMAVVAVVAVSLGLYETMRRRAQDYHVRAWYHLAASHQLAAESRSFFCLFGVPQGQKEEVAARQSAERQLALEASEYHAKLYRKYLHASAWPWLPIGDDPPSPPGGYPKIVTADDY